VFHLQGVEPIDCPPVTIVGNKCDLVDERVISEEDGRRIAAEMSPNVGYVETSAKSDFNVNEVGVQWQTVINLNAHHLIDYRYLRTLCAK
jgi:GTPase SAR1 family protein